MSRTLGSEGGRELVIWLALGWPVAALLGLALRKQHQEMVKLRKENADLEEKIDWQILAGWSPRDKTWE